MKNQTMLVVLTTQTPDSEVAAFLEEARSNNTRVLLLILSEGPAYPAYAAGHMPYGAVEIPAEWLEDLQTSKARLHDRGEACEKLLQAAEVPGEVHPVQCARFDIREIVAQRAMVCDLATMAESVRETDPELFHQAAHGILFESPIGLFLNTSPLANPGHVFVAWNTKLPASRAAHAALPLLKAAREVTIGCVDHHAAELDDGEDPGTQIAKWLSHHGAKVTVNQYPSGGADISEVLRRRAQEIGADLIVMGAYGHTRMRELVFGGVTRSMLEDTDLPIFIAH